MIVQSAEAKLPMSPAELSKGHNPCAITRRRLEGILKTYSRTAGVFETTSFGIAAQCGHTWASFGLPTPAAFDAEALRQTAPDIVRLWSLASEIAESAFGPEDIFLDRTEVDDQALQRSGEKIVPELNSGKYDLGLAMATRGNVGTWKSPSFRSLLVGYHGTLNTSDVGFVVTVLNAQAYQFSQFTLPKYPPLAKAAQIQGDVDLLLTVGSETGEIINVVVQSGHPLLTPAAIDAAKRWRFDKGASKADTVTIKLRFELRCP
jgi:TonB family protein